MAVSRENQVRSATEGAANFVEWYYRALQEGSPIGPFYASNNAKYAASSTASDISINGAVLPGGPAEYERLLERQRTTPAGLLPASKVHWEVEGWDAHVLNPDFALARPPGDTQPSAAGRESLLLQVSGQIAYGADKDAPRRPFAETFVLVPNWDALRRNPPRNMRKKLILSQNFRAL